MRMRSVVTLTLAAAVLVAVRRAWQPVTERGASRAVEFATWRERPIDVDGTGSYG